MNTMEINKNLNFILSTGRTGTMFFEEYINASCRDAVCLHEPHPSRRFIPLSNMYFQQKITAERFNKIYIQSRKDLWSKTPEKTYIESSNFMWAGVKSLNSVKNNIKILHIVRHPQDYIKSHYDYGFWKHYKQMIRKYVPYFIADLPITNKEKKDPIMVLASRWKLINESLNTYVETNPYLMVRFEDIFKTDAEKGALKLNEIRAFFDLEALDLAETISWLSKPKNTSKKKKTAHLIDSYKGYIETELLDLMGYYEYELK